jgi:hypothetical protein
MKTKLLALALIVLVATLPGCKRRQQTESLEQTSVSLPLLPGKVWRDTTAQKTVKGVGTFTVVARNGQITVQPPAGLKKFRWAVVSAPKAEMHSRTTITAAPVAEGDMDGDGVPDCEDWCMDTPGTPENRGCPPGVEGIPPIRWIELLRMTEEGQEIIIQYGLDECVEE